MTYLNSKALMAIKKNYIISNKEINKRKYYFFL